MAPVYDAFEFKVNVVEALRSKPLFEVAELPNPMKIALPLSFEIVAKLRPLVEVAMRSVEVLLPHKTPPWVRGEFIGILAVPNFAGKGAFEVPQTKYAPRTNIRAVSGIEYFIDKLLGS